MVPIGARQPLIEGLQRLGQSEGPHMTPAVEFAGRQVASSNWDPTGQEVVPAGPKQPTLVMFQAIAALLKRGVGFQDAGHNRLQMTPAVVVAAVTRSKPKVHCVVRSGPRQAFATRAQPRGQNLGTVRGTQRVPAGPAVGLVVGAELEDVVVALALIHPRGHLDPGLPRQPPRTRVKLAGQVKDLPRVQIRPVTEAARAMRGIEVGQVDTPAGPRHPVEVLRQPEGQEGAQFTLDGTVEAQMILVANLVKPAALLA